MLISILISISEISKYMELISSLVLAVLIFLLLRYKGIRVPRVLKNIKTIALCFIAVFILLLTLEKKYIENYYAGYRVGYHWESELIDGWEWMDANTTGSKIAHTANCATYPLYGARLKNSVEYISVNDKEPYLHSYPDGSYYFDGDSQKFFKSLENKGNYRENPNYNVWLANLRKKEIEYLFISDLYFSKRFPIENEWAYNNREVFELVFSNPRTRIYKVNYGNQKE